MHTNGIICRVRKKSGAFWKKTAFIQGKVKLHLEQRLKALLVLRMLFTNKYKKTGCNGKRQQKEKTTLINIACPVEILIQDK